MKEKILLQIELAAKHLAELEKEIQEKVAQFNTFRGAKSALENLLNENVAQPVAELPIEPEAPQAAEEKPSDNGEVS